MCGIAGFHAHAAAARTVTRDTLTAMRDRMAARGPDGAGLWIADDDRTGFGHRRLSIIDLSEGGHQPMATPDGRLTIVFNGEVYNYRALRDELIADGVRFVGGSDTEVMLQLYARDRSLLLARDPLGIKPLYYSDTGGTLTFASQVKALLTDPAISRDPSPAGVAGFHLMGSVPEPFTAWRAIRALPAGSWLKIDPSGVGAPVAYANAAQVLADGRTRDPASVDVAAALRDSVAHHLVADVEVGAFLSGGVDSSALIGLMRDCGQERIRACTLAFGEFDGRHQDETPGAAMVARHYGVDHHIRRVDAAEFRADMDAIFDAMDQPSIDGINSWFVSKAVREMGLKVALSGLGGDELLAGYSTFRSVPATKRRFGPLAAIPGAGTLARLVLGATGMAKRNPKAAGVLDYAGSWAGAYLLRRAVLLPFELDGAMDPGMAREGLAELDPLGTIGRSITPDPGSDTGRVCALETGNYMRNQLLRDSDWAGMAHSLEIRVPLVDYTLLGTLAPVIATLKPGEGKALLAAAPSNPVPRDIVERSKTGFSIPVADWLAGNAAHVPDRRASRDWAKVATARSLQGVAALAR